jgi:hypothetical protein
MLLLAKNEKILKMANRYKVPNLNVNYFLCGQGCVRNEALTEMLVVAERERKFVIHFGV